MYQHIAKNMTKSLRAIAAANATTVTSTNIVRRDQRSQRRLGAGVMGLPALSVAPDEPTEDSDHPYPRH
jgi:hypothetical protein